MGGRAVPTRASYNLPTGIGRFPSADSSQGNTIGGQILNMFNTENVGRLYRESAADYGESAADYIIPIPTHRLLRNGR